jgi:cobalt-zinc-cadmium efflux system membrane fusion protein
MKMKREFLVRGAVAALLIGAAYGAWKHWGEKTEEAPPAPVKAGNQVLRYPPGAPQLSFLRIEPVDALPVPMLEGLHGRIAYDDDVTAKIFSPVNGRVTRIVAQTGETVKAGQPLVWLDSPDYAQAVADRLKAEADRRAKAQALARSKMLYEGEVLAKKDLEAAEDDAAQAEAEAVRARARLHNLNFTDALGKDGFALRAPLAGVVTERQVNAGTEVRADAQNPLYVVTDPTRLWVVAEMAEKDLGKVRVGQTVSVMVDAYPREHFIGKVAAVGDVLDPATRRVTVRCDLDNKDHRLKPEMYARIMPVAEGQRLPRLPNSALVTEGLYTYIFVETRPGTLEKRRVEMAFRGTEDSYVKTGLKEGERVVTAGALLLNSELAGN